MRTPGYGITPDRFVRVAHLLPRQCGNVAVDNHTFVNALLWMCRTGAPWRDLPECYGKWVTVYQRFDRWSGNGATGCLSTALQEERIIGVEIRVPAMDSTGGKVHQHAAGAPKKGGLPVRRRLPGRAERQGSRGVRRREHGRRDPCEPGRRARRGPRAPLDGRARRVRGRAPAHGPRVREGFHPTASRVVRPDAGRNPKRNRTAPWDYDRKAHKGRNMVERVFNRMKHHRKAATRHDRLDETFLANLQLIPIAIYLKNTAKNPISVNTP